MGCGAKARRSRQAVLFFSAGAWLTFFQAFSSTNEESRLGRKNIPRQPPSRTPQRACRCYLAPIQPKISHASAPTCGRRPAGRLPFGAIFVAQPAYTPVVYPPPEPTFLQRPKEEDATANCLVDAFCFVTGTPPPYPII